MKKTLLIEEINLEKVIRVLIRLSIIGIGLGVIVGSFLTRIPSKIINLDTPKQRVSKIRARGFISTERLNLKVYKQQKEIVVLSESWEKLLKEQKGLKASAYVILENGKFAQVKENDLSPAAGSVKIAILLIALQMLDRGELIWNEPIKLNKNAIANGSGWIRYQPIGKNFPLHEIAMEMIRVSDNTATNLLIQRIGGIEELNKRLKNIGLNQTRLKTFLPDLEGSNTTSALEMVQIIIMAESRNILSSKSRDLFRELMKMSVSNLLLPDGILKGLGIPPGNTDYKLLIEGFRVYNKNGDIGKAYVDAGLIQMPDGSRAIASFIVQGPFNDPRSSELIRNMASAMVSAIKPIDSKEQN